MKLYSGTSNEVPKSTPFNHIDQEVDKVHLPKQIQDYFKYSRLLLLGGITLFLLGVYFLIAFVFLHTSSGISKNNRHLHSIDLERSILYNSGNPNSDFDHSKTLNLHFEQKSVRIKNEFFIQICESDDV